MNSLEKLSRQKAILFSFIITFAMLLIEQIEWDGDPYMGWDMILSRTIICILAIWLMKKRSILNRASFQKEGYGKGLIWGVPLLLLGAGSAIYSNWGIDRNTLGLPDIKDTLMFTASMFTVAAAEEFVFRGLLLNNMIKKFDSGEKGVRSAIILSALIFGAAHLTGVFMSPPVTVIVQAINAASAGVLFSVIYICCKNIWAVVTLHMLVDWMALFLQQCFTGTTSIITNEVSVVQAIFVVFVGSVVPLLLSHYIFRNINKAA